MYEAIAVCSYGGNQRVPFNKHVKIEGIGMVSL